METSVQNASAFHSKTLQHCVARKLITQVHISATIALPSSVPCCKHTSDVWWCATYCALWGPWQNFCPPPSTHTPHHCWPLKTGPSQVVAALWREVGPLCLRGGAAPHMINDLARPSGHETWFIHEGFHLHVSEYLTPVTVSAGCWHTKQHGLCTTAPSRLFTRRSFYRSPEKRR